MNEYQVEYYINPKITYLKLSDKLRLGHLIYDLEDQTIKIVSLPILSEIVKWETSNSESLDMRYFPIPLTKKWLEKVFCFESKYNQPNYMTVFTSIRHGLKIHNQNDKFFIGIRNIEKFIAKGMTGGHTSKPRILYVNELMDYLYLLKRDNWDFSEQDLEKINMIIKVQ